MEYTQADLSAFYQAPCFYLLRNVCSPAIATIIVQDFKNVKFLEENLKLRNDRPNVKNSSSSTSQRSNPRNKNTQVCNQQQPLYIDLEAVTVSQFLRKIHQKGKKRESRLKRAEVKDDQGHGMFSRTLHLNNLKENEKILDHFKASDLLCNSQWCEIINSLSECDVAFLLNLLTNEVLDYQLNKVVYEAVCQMRHIRNCMHHSSHVDDDQYERDLKSLCNSLKVLYEYLGWELSQLLKEEEKARNEYTFCRRQLELSQLSIGEDKERNKYTFCLRQIASVIFDGIYQSMREDFSRTENDFQECSIMPPLVDTRKEMGVIENFEQFLGYNRDPVVLCGPPGSGKSTVLDHLRQRFYTGDHNLKYKLLIYVKSSYRVTESCDFSELTGRVRDVICRVSQKAIKEYGVELVMSAFSLLADNVLYLVNQNISNFENREMEDLNGKWVFCTQSSCDEWSMFHCVGVMPLSETLVKQMLHGLLPNKIDYDHIIKLYNECTYKFLLTSPDLVRIYSETDLQSRVSCYKLLESYLNKKCASIANVKNSCEVLGRLVFYSILKNKNWYSVHDLQHVDSDLKSLLFLPKRDQSFTFRFHVIEDFFAASFIMTNPQEACRKWINQVPLFKRVFRYVCEKWCEDRILSEERLQFLKPYLEHYIDPKCVRNKKKNTRCKENSIPDANERYSKENSFTKWGFLISLAQCCNYQRDILQFLGHLLSQKSNWVFKCKYLEEEDIDDKLASILEIIDLTNPIYIKIESGTSASTACKLWTMLSRMHNLKKYTTVQFIIMHRGGIFPVACERKLLRLPAFIAQAGEPLYITQYKGPFLCSETPDFLKCPCMRKLEVLDVYVYDIASLCEAFACEGLENLKALWIRVELRFTETSKCTPTLSQECPSLKVPSLPRDASLNLSVKYFDGLSFLLERIMNPSKLKSLTIHGMFIKRNVRLDLTQFTRLDALYIHFNPHAKNSYEKTLGEAGCISMNENQFMDVDNHGDQIALHREWPFEFVINSPILPKGLKRFMLRNAEFWSDANGYLLERLWKRKNLQRLILLDSSLSIKGVRRILESSDCRNYDYGQNVVETSNIGNDGVNLGNRQNTLENPFTGNSSVSLDDGMEDEADINQLEQKFKKHAIDTNDCTNDRKKRQALYSDGSANISRSIRKHSRLCKEEREKRRSCKPKGKKELIISSQLKMCNNCSNFPCVCERLPREDVRDSLEDFVQLIQDAYEYDLLSLSYESGVIAIRKDVCGDLRVRCPLTTVSDYDMANLDVGLVTFFESLNLAQGIELYSTKLSLNGVKLVIQRIIKVKESNGGKKPEPFALTVTSSCCWRSDDEVINNTFLDYLRQETWLKQFKFCFCNDKERYIKKTIENMIFVNNKLQRE